MKRTTKLREAGATLLFFGALAHRPDLRDAGTAALAELASQGYQITSEDSPIRVFPALTEGAFSGRHAGGWRPGVIYLRQQPLGSVTDQVYLRHELYHEADYRSCGGKTPLWAAEAGAMSFSGELNVQSAAVSSPASEAEVEKLRLRISRGGRLTDGELGILGRLVRESGWPLEPCAQSPKLAGPLGSAFAEAGSNAYLLINLASGRVLESGGDQQSRYPPSSLLKIPYAASITSASPVDLGRELIASDTGKLLRRWDDLDRDRLRLLLSPAEIHGGGQADLAGDAIAKRAYLGERDDAGNYPILANLPELARILRAALLSQPGYFQGLRQNGESADSTLASRDDAEKALLRNLQALAKTGTASDERGNPLVGHLLVAWPARHPVYLALFRQRGVAGAQVLQQAADRLRVWRQVHPVRFGSVRVRLLTLTPRASWEAVDECPAFFSRNARISLCGEFRILSSARGSRSERGVTGVLSAQSGGATILETDVETYADAVSEVEAQGLMGSAAEAMRAVIVWNGSHGGNRHGDSSAVCDTSHCMVFLGAQLQPHRVRRLLTDPRLLSVLDRLASRSKQRWFPFATGGSERWEQAIGASQLARQVGESDILSIRREHRKDERIVIHLVYPTNEDALDCEVFRNTFRLPSCPDEIILDSEKGAWVFRGMGAGHGLGLSIARAAVLAAAGRSAEQILLDAYDRESGN